MPGKKGGVISLWLIPVPWSRLTLPFRKIATISSGGKAISMTVGVTNASVFERRESQVRSVNVVAFTNGFHGVFHELRKQQQTALL